jgi:hypothetical protein
MGKWEICCLANGLLKCANNNMQTVTSGHPCTFALHIALLELTLSVVLKKGIFVRARCHHSSLMPLARRQVAKYVGIMVIGNYT